MRCIGHLFFDHIFSTLIRDDGIWLILRWRYFRMGRRQLLTRST